MNLGPHPYGHPPEHRSGMPVRPRFPENLIGIGVFAHVCACARMRAFKYYLVDIASEGDWKQPFPSPVSVYVPVGLPDEVWFEDVNCDCPSSVPFTPFRRRGAISERHVHGAADSGPFPILMGLLRELPACRRSDDRRPTSGPTHTPCVSQCSETDVIVRP